MKFRKLKQVLALTLAAAMTVGGMGVPGMTASAGEGAAAERTARGGSMENGMSYSAQELNTNFNGTNVFEALSADVGLFKENIQNATSLDLSITFKPTTVSNFMNLLEISNSSKNHTAASPAEELGLILGSNGVVYLMTGAYKGSTDWNIATGTTIAANQTYTLDLSVSGDGLTVQLNGGEKKTVNKDADSNNKNTKKFVQAFFGGSVTGYTNWKQNIDSVVIGGLKSGSYQTHSNFVNFKGEITNITIAGKNSAVTPVGNGVASIMFKRDSLDNTWLFGGGVETQGRYEEIGGVRNFIGQFEEHVRWVKRVDGTLLGMQRYTMNAGKAGQDAAAFAERLPELITKVDPMAVSYLIGPEDYNGEGGTAAFKTALSEIIDTALAMKSGAGCAVIQYPHAVNNAETNTKIEAYIAAAQEVIQGKEASVKERIAVVDHYAQTKNNDNFKNTMLTQEGLLNAQGHYEIAKQFSQEVYGDAAGFPTISENWTAEEAPNAYLDVMPEVTAAADSLKVSVSGVEGTEWKYILTIDGTEVKGTASGNPFTIEKLPANADYELVVQTGDGATQLSAVAGTIAEGEKAQAPRLSAMQQAICDKAENTEDSLIWLFMGDSITHAAAHTHGYDGIAQIFEKYLKEDLGRTDDIVVNTAVSGATAERTIANVEQRMTKYKPDIVSIMLGTNDTINESLYNNNLKRIVEKIREVNPDALIIFRSPTPAKSDAYAKKTLGESGSIAQMKKVAEECGNILFIDQFTEWNKETTAYPYLFTPGFYYGDSNIHPGAAGQLRMVQQFIKECGLNTNTEIANLSYQFTYGEETGNIDVPVTAAPHAIKISRDSLQEAYSSSETIGDFTVTATDSATGRTYTKESGMDGEDVILSNLPANTTYSISVVANIAGNTAKHVTFAQKDVELKEDLEVQFGIKLDGSSKLTGIAAGTKAGKLSVDGMAPAGEYTYTLCDGEGSDNNDLFAITGNTLRIRKELEVKQTYSVRVKAESGRYSAEEVFTFTTSPTLEAVRAAAAEAFEKDKTALDLDVSEVDFNGSTSVNLADSGSEYYHGGDYMTVLENLRQSSEGGTIIVRFSTQQNGIIFGAGSTYADDGKNMVFASNSGAVRVFFRDKASGLRGNLGNGLDDGNMHTAAVSFMPESSKIIASIDGSQNLVEAAPWQKPSWFSIGSDVITNFEIGGPYGSVGGFGYFNGKISFVTITDETFTEDELKVISGDKGTETETDIVTIVEGEQEVSISGDTVSVADDAQYTAALAWDDTDKNNGTITLTANADTAFTNDMKLAFSNLEALGYQAGAAQFSEDGTVVTIAISKRQTEPTETPEQKNLKEMVADLAAEIAQESAYTPASFGKFKEAYEAAKKAIADGETDAVKLNKLLADLKQAKEGLVVHSGTPTPSTPDQPDQPTPPTPPTQVIEAGKTYDDGKYSYKVLSTADMTAEVTGIKNTAIKKVVVANSVKLGGKDYKVVSVAANAFKGNKKITSVSVKKNVKTIGKNAFAGCTKLKKVTISSTKLTTINAKAFSGCKSLKTITIKSKVLKKVGKNAFKGIHKKAVIRVPKAKRAAYKGKILKNKGQAKTVKIK